ncbi:UDP-N-acetylglucosamine 2-epimerase [Bacillus sp. JCM 19046]|nr:UDP-N-acetylglucosamine 2-epimerase [Bacillus sp. JCM 19046]
MKLVTVIGARPQFIKACMVSKRLRQDASIQEVLVHTGQHYNANMSDVFFDQLNIPKPDYHLGIGSGSHGEQTGKMLMELEQVLVKEKPDAVLVYGDTNSTIAGSLASSKLHIPIIHVESGLRSSIAGCLKKLIELSPTIYQVCCFVRRKRQPLS